MGHGHFGQAGSASIYTSTSTTTSSATATASKKTEGGRWIMDGAGLHDRPDLALPCRLPWPGLHSVRQRFPHSLLQPPLRSDQPHATSSAAFLPPLTVTSPTPARVPLPQARARALQSLPTPADSMLGLYCSSTPGSGVVACQSGLLTLL